MANRITLKLKERYSGPGGYKQLMAIAFPLIMSTGSWSLMQFIDRMFLTWYSTEAIAAVMPAGMLHFALISFFMGTANYVNTFVAQYFGSNNHHRIGSALWQSLYMSIIGGSIIMLSYFFADRFFAMVGHPPKVMAYEIEYFQILCYGSIPVLGASALSGFYAGRGKSWPVMWVNLSGAAINIVLDYIFIFGLAPVPEMGVRGAAYATVISACSNFFIYCLLIFRPKFNHLYNTLKSWRFEPELFKRMLRYGVPNGVQFFLEMAGITVFILMIGRLGKVELAATNIAFNINTLAFLPMIGIGIAVSVLVGQYVAAGKTEIAEKSSYSGFYITTAYLVVISIFYFFLPELFILPFEKGASYEHFDTIKGMVIILLKFVAIYSIADGLNIVFGFAIKGAGDTKFAMIAISLCSMFILVIPNYFLFVVFKASLYYGWVIATGYIIIMGIIFFVRFRQGKWKNMRVIEHSEDMPASLAE